MHVGRGSKNVQSTVIGGNSCGFDNACTGIGQSTSDTITSIAIQSSCGDNNLQCLDEKDDCDNSDTNSGGLTFINNVCNQ